MKPSLKSKCDCGNKIENIQWGICEECRYLVNEEDDEYFDPDLEVKSMRELAEG